MGRTVYSLVYQRILYGTIDVTQKLFVREDHFLIMPNSNVIEHYSLDTSRMFDDRNVQYFSPIILLINV